MATVLPGSMWGVTCNSATWAETARIARNDSTEVICKSFVWTQDPKSFQDSLCDVLFTLQRPKRIAQQTRWCCSVAVLGPVVLLKFVVLLFLLPFLPFFIFLSFLPSIPSLPPRFSFSCHRVLSFCFSVFLFGWTLLLDLFFPLFFLCNFFSLPLSLWGGGVLARGIWQHQRNPFAGATPTSELQDKNWCPKQHRKCTCDYLMKFPNTASKTVATLAASSLDRRARSS